MTLPRRPFVLSHLVWLALFVFAALPAAHAAPIQWGGGARDIRADTDVSTNGVLVRALAKAGAAAPTVNGVTFGPFPGPDTLSGQNKVNRATGALPVGNGISPDYATLLSQNDYSDASGATLTLTLNELLPGHHYELQLWFHDANASGLGTLRLRTTGALDHGVLLDANPSNTAGGRGQYVLGTFTADATTQVLRLTGSLAVLQAYQLRLVSTPLAPVVWDRWRETTGPADVTTEGTLARAYAFGATAPAGPVNGVTFTRFLDQSGDTLSGFTRAPSDVFGSTAAPFASFPADYRALLGGAVSGGRAGTLTLNDLQSGQWYYLQVWSNDSRASGGGRLQRINNSLFHNANPGGPSDNLAYEGGLGHRLSGRFQATASSQRFEFVSPNAVQLNALQLRAIPEPDPALTGLRQRRLFVLQSFLDGTITSGNPWVSVQARFVIGDFARARAELAGQAAYYATTDLVATHSFHLWPAMDLFIRHRGFIDQLSRDRFISTLRKFKFRLWANTSNLTKLSWTIRTLGSQEFGEPAFIFPDNAWSTTDITGYTPLLQRLEQEARKGTGEYASGPYGWLNVNPTLSSAEFSTDPVLRSRARITYDLHLAQLAAQYMPGNYLATFSGRNYPLAAYAGSIGRHLWFWFGQGELVGQGQEMLMPAVSDYEPPLPLLLAGSDRSSIYTTRHRADGFQTAYIYRDEFGFYSHDGWGGGDQTLPDGLRWRGMESYLWITRPVVDTPALVRASNAPGTAPTDYSTLQHRDTQLMAFDLSPSTPIPYAVGYVPGRYSAMVNLTGAATPADGRSRIFLHYGRVMVSIAADIPFTWKPDSGIYCKWGGAKPGDSEFRIAVGGVGSPATDPDTFDDTINKANNRFAIAIEVAHPEEFPGATPAAQLAAFQAAILARTTLSRDPAPGPTTAQYTTRRGDRLRVTSKSGVDYHTPRTAYINDVPLHYDATWPMLENPWMSQPAHGANATLTGGGHRTLLDLTNWTRTDTLAPVVDPLPRLAATRVLGLGLNAATAVGRLAHPGDTPAAVTLFWGATDAGTANPAAWANQVSLGSPADGTLLASLSGLTPNTGYAFRFRATNAAGTVWSSAITFRTPAIAPPPAPRNLRFTLTSGSIPLAWDAAPGATSYAVSRATTSGGPYTTLVSGLTGLAHTDTTGVTGTVYYYVVTATGLGGDSGDSAQLTATKAALPAAPTGFTVTTRHRYAYLDWSPVPWAATYTVKRSPVSSGPFVTIATGLTDTFFEDTTSVHGTRYYYLVTATNLVGTSANSVTINHLVQVAAHIGETSGAWSAIPWFPSSAGQPTSGATTGIEFDNQSGPISSQQNRGPFTLNHLRFRGQNVTLTGDPLTFAGTSPGAPRVTVASTSTSSIANTLTLSVPTTFDIAGSLTVSAPVAGPGELIKTGTGTLTLAQTDPQTRNLTLGGGRLLLSAPQPALGGLTFGTSVRSPSAGTLEIGGDANARSLNVRTAAVTNRLVIAPGRTLTVTGSHIQGGLYQGAESSHLAISGGGTYQNVNATGDFVIRGGSTLDLSASGPVNITAARFLLGDLDNTLLTSSLILPTDADTRIRADRFALSTFSTTGNSVRGESSRLVARGGTGRFTLRNTAGTGPSLFEADRNNGGSIHNTTFYIDFRGQPVDLWLSELHLARRNQANSVDSQGEFHFDSGLLRVDGLTTLSTSEPTGSSKNISVLSIGGGEAYFTGGIAMAAGTNGQVATADFYITGGTVVSGPISLVTASPGYCLGTLDITGGSLTLTGPITRGHIATLLDGNHPSNASARLLLDGGLLDLGGHAIGSALAPIHSVALNSGTLKNVASINGSAGLTKTSPGTLTLDGSSTWTGPTAINTDTLEVLGTLQSPGIVTIGTEATLTGSGTLRAPVVIHGILAPGTATAPVLRLERTVTLSATSTVLTQINRAAPAASPALAGPTTLNYGGTLRVLHEGAPLQEGDRFVLFTAAVFTGNFTTYDLPVLAPDLAWDTRGLRSDGALLVRKATDLAASLANTTKYWDRSAAPGLQGGVGPWDVATSADWNLRADGSGLFDRFWPGDAVRFQTGITNRLALAGAPVVHSLVQSGPGTATTLTGGSLSLVGASGLSNGTLSGDQPFVLDTVVNINVTTTTAHAQQPITLTRGLAGSGTVIKTGASTLTLAGPHTFIGQLHLGGGLTRIESPMPGLNGLLFGPTVGASPGSTLQLTTSLTVPGPAFKLQSIGTNHLDVAAGHTLTLTGETFLGLNYSSLTGVASPTVLTTSGGGALVVDTVGKNFSVAGGHSGNHPAQLDLTGLGSLTVNTGSTGNLYLGVYLSNTNDFLHLPPVATLTGGNFFVGDTNPVSTVALRFGAGPTLLHLNNLYVGQRPGANNRSDATVGFLPGATAAATLRLRAADGTGRANLWINDNSSGTSRTLTNVFDVTGRPADLLLNQLVLSRRNATSQPTTLTNDTFAWDRGTLDVLAPALLAQAPPAAQKTHLGTMILGSAASTVADTATFRGGLLVAENRSTVADYGASVSAGAVVRGTLTIAGGHITSTGLTLGELATLTAPTRGTRQAHATLNLTGGTLTLTAPLRSGTTAGPGTKTATVNLTGGRLDLGGHALGSTGPAALTTLNLQSGTLANVASINGTQGLTKTSLGTLTLDGTHAFTGPLAVSAGTLALTPTARVTAPVTVASGATLIHPGKLAADLTLASGALDAPLADGTTAPRTVGGHYTLPAGATLRLRLTSATAYDQLVLTGPASTATLGGTLDLLAAPDLIPGTRFTLIKNTGTPAAAAPVAGIFAGLPAFQPFTAGGYTWFLDYAGGPGGAGGAGGDVVLALVGPLDQWRITHFGSPAPSGPAALLADPDRDGANNLLEYALGSDPTSRTSAARPTIAVSGQKLTLTFLRARADVTYHVEATSSLAAPVVWTTIATNPGNVSATIPVTVTDVIEVHTGTPPRRYLRLRVAVP